MEGTRSGLPLLAASARPRAGVVLAGCAVLVAVLGAVFARQNMADRFDHAVDAPVITWFAGHHGLALWLAFPGTTKPAVALSLVIAAACLLVGLPPAPCWPSRPSRSPSGCASCSSSPWSTAPISVRLSTRAGTSQRSPRWQRQLRCCLSRHRGRCWRARYGCSSSSWRT